MAPGTIVRYTGQGGGFRWDLYDIDVDSASPLEVVAPDVADLVDGDPSIPLEKYPEGDVNLDLSPVDGLAIAPESVHADGDITTDGSVGPPNNPIETAVERLYTQARGPTAVVHQEEGTWYASGPSDEIDSGANAVTVAQSAYDHLANNYSAALLALQGTLDFDNHLDMWQSRIGVCLTGEIIPKESYTGYLVRSRMRDGATIEGPDSRIFNLNLWGSGTIDGQRQAKGVELNDLNLSHIGPLHVRKTDGPGMRVADGVIESQFEHIRLSDDCGNASDPALLIKPRNASRSAYPDFDIPVNNISWDNLHIHYPWDDAIIIDSDPVTGGTDARQMFFDSISLHAKGPRTTKPLVSIPQAISIKFDSGTIRGGDEDGRIFKLGDLGSNSTAGDIRFSGITFGTDNLNATAIHMENVNQDEMIGISNCQFRGVRPVDWGAQTQKKVGWSANHVVSPPTPVFLGQPPRAGGPYPLEEPVRPIKGYFDNFDGEVLHPRVSGTASVKSGTDDSKTLAANLNWFEDSGSPSLGGGALTLPAGNSTRQAVFRTHAIPAGGFRYQISAQSTPSSGSLYLRFLVETRATDDLFMELDAAGGAFLKKTDGGSESTLVSGAWAADTGSYFVQTNRNPGGSFDFRVDFSAQGSVTDSYLPAFDRMILDNTMDVAVDITQVQCW
ncbi:hypothetical protein C2R22_05860 [Salinigranum rubrum]|uniref:Uncharacterized protein n=1 Tax=Salinigranum rubrum TaxID=755307 RepID=A0A2I8VH32_9EURY|nr:hypothetical protein [Salinigranum rubrum]AUV81243.1 hypothetical protein C2R22_05860 [Salinigranum rubrum]